jgi:hypothetical protein
MKRYLLKSSGKIQAKTPQVRSQNNIKDTKKFNPFLMS